MQDKKMQDWNLEDNFAGQENAELENAGVEKKPYMKYKCCLVDFSWHVTSRAGRM